VEKVAREHDLQTATTQDKGHGRLETRTIETLTKLPPWLDWPGVQQVCRLTRTRTLKGTSSVEIILAVTSLTRVQANAKKLLTLSRQHWSIENQLHWVRDVTMGEDACRVRSGQAPEFMAALRNACIGLQRRGTKARYLPDAIRRFQAQPFAALNLVRPGIPVQENDF
jgi:predicted transposase YbfD/YdcC